MTFAFAASESDAALRRHALRVYGACCIGGNVLVLLKGIAIHDPLIVSSGTLGALGQTTNAIGGNAMKPYTVPALIAAASLFAGSGLHSGSHSHVAFGGIKALGLATLFYGCRVPAERLISRLRSVQPELVGEAMLSVATASLGYDGVDKLARGLATGDHREIVNGVVTIVATAGFLVGQRFASITQKHTRLDLARSGGGIAPSCAE